MSLTEPPPSDEKELDRPPSRRFTIFFSVAMVLIAVGYMWVWQAKTSRTVAEPPPPLVLGQVTSPLPGHDGARLRDALAAELRSIRGLALFNSLRAVPPPDTLPGRPVPVAYALNGVLDRAADGQYSLQLERTDARTDSVVYIYRVRGPTLPEVVHRMAVQVAMSFGLPLPTRDTVPAQPDGDSALQSGAR